MSRKQNVIIVGNGLFGSIAAAACREAGHTVTVVSDDRTGSASKASGCVIAPSWLSSLSREEIDTGFSVLGRLYEVQDITFSTNLLGSFKAKRVALESVLLPADVAESVVEVGDGYVKTASGLKLRGKVLVAAGYWAGQLVAMPPIRGLWGASVSFKTTGQAPKINVYAPYRQAVLFQASKSRAWMGDGSALVEKTWLKEASQRKAATVERGRSMLVGNAAAPAIVTEGVRPYVEGYKGGYFERVHRSTWVSTGGAKNGTLLAALQAHRFLEELR